MVLLLTLPSSNLSELLLFCKRSLLMNTGKTSDRTNETLNLELHFQVAFILMSKQGRMLLKPGTGNGERGTGNGERGTGNGSLGTNVQRQPA